MCAIFGGGMVFDYMYVLHMIYRQVVVGRSSWLTVTDHLVIGVHSLQGRGGVRREPHVRRDGLVSSGSWEHWYTVEPVCTRWTPGAETGVPYAAGRGGGTGGVG